MKRLFDAVPLLLLVMLAAALFYVGQPGGLNASAAQNKPDSAEVARTDTIDAGLRPDSLVRIDSVPELIEESKPEYPPAELKAGIQGKLWVKTLISRNGNVLKATVIKNESGNENLAKSAIDAALKNRYKPARVNGQPVAVWVTYSVVFKLDDRPASTNKQPPKP